MGHRLSPHPDAQTRKLRAFPAGCAGRARCSENALPGRPGARGSAVGDLGAPRERRTSQCGPRQCLPRGLGLGQLRSFGSRARRSFPPRRLSGGGVGSREGAGSKRPGPCPASPASDLESCLPRWALRVPSRPPPHVLGSELGGWNGKRGPAFLTGLCGGKGHLASSPGRDGRKGGEPVAGQPRRGVEHDLAFQWGGTAGRLRTPSLRGPARRNSSGGGRRRAIMGAFSGCVRRHSLGCCGRAGWGGGGGRPRSGSSDERLGHSLTAAGAWKWPCRHPRPAPFALLGLALRAQEPPRLSLSSGGPPGPEPQAQVSWVLSGGGWARPPFEAKWLPPGRQKGLAHHSVLPSRTQRAPSAVVPSPRPPSLGGPPRRGGPCP